MSFENLIWIIVVLIYVISVILKKKRVATRPEAADKPQKGPEWKEKLDRYLAQIKQEIKTELEDAATEKEIRREDKAAPAVIVEAPKSWFEKGAVIKEIELSPDDLSPETRAVKPEKKSETSARPERVSRFGINDLQKAIIWSEILGPPVALKNHFN